MNFTVKFCRFLRFHSKLKFYGDFFYVNSRQISGAKRLLPQDGLELRDFISASQTNNDVKSAITNHDIPPYIQPSDILGFNRKVYFDVYGCQMNVNDTEIVWSILDSAGFAKTNDITQADVILMMTCAIRDNAENKIWNKLVHYRHMKNKSLNKNHQVKVGILGCMAERLKTKLLEKETCIDLVCGPDSYKDLPRLLAITDKNEKAVNVLLSLDETYADIVPVRLDSDSVTAYVSIMRGCDNMCSYCIVPFTRGRERSRPVDSILKEVNNLANLGVKEITLLGQNVNSYRDISNIRGAEDSEETVLAPGFNTVYKKKKGGVRFAQLLDRVASQVPHVRIRFTSPHPKDFPLQVLETMSKHSNICKSLHVPAQSGSDSVLERMRRGYTSQAYLQLIDTIRKILPQVTLSSDFICGFCGETENDFQQTLDLIRNVKYNIAYLFAYSMREKTTAHRRYTDDVAQDIKQERLIRMIKEFRSNAYLANQHFMNTQQVILIQGVSKRSDEYLQGRTDGNIKVIIPSVSLSECSSSGEITNKRPIKKGDYVNVKIIECNSQVLRGLPLNITSLTA